MIYMVEHTFGLPAMEAEWNRWYSDYLRVLLAVPGIDTAQRFIVADSKPPRYMAMYTISSGDVFESEIYKRSGGGGTASARFRPAYQTWTRNLFEYHQRAPAPEPDEVLHVCDREAPGDAGYLWLKTSGLHKTTAYRGLAVTKAGVSLENSATVYQPLTRQLKATC